MKRLAYTALACVFLLAAAPRGGPHDFDFEFGAWNVQVARLTRPLAGSKAWVHYAGTHTVYKIWNGKANYGVLEINGGGRHIEGMQIRLYNPQTRQWSLSFASSADGVLGTPSVGGFENGHGVFYSRETFDGRPVLVRGVTTVSSANTYRDDIAISPDGGKTWITYWIARYTRA